MNEIITYEKVLEYWKNKNFPKNFDDLLHHYLEIKLELFKSDFEIKDLHRWLDQVLFSIEIGMKRDEKKFEKFYKFFKSLLGERWKIKI